MKNRLRIGDAIYTILKEFKNVYPVKADEGTTFPFMIYRRVSGYSQSSKDGIYSSIANIEVNIVAQNLIPDNGRECDHKSQNADLFLTPIFKYFTQSQDSEE